MTDKAKSEVRVVDVIRRKVRGGTAGAVAWAMVGGRFDSSGNAVPTDLGNVKPGDFIAAAKAGSRAAEVASRPSGVLVRSKHVAFRIPGASGQNMGYWPSGVTRAVPAVVEPLVEVASRGVARSEVLGAEAVRSGVADLSGFLDGSE